VTEKIIILDFGSQYTQLIARKARENNVYCEIHPFNNYPAPDDDVKGYILSGSPFSVRDQNAPIPDIGSIKGKYPILGICYGAQYLSHFFGGEVAASGSREYGRARLTKIDNSDPLLQDIPINTQVWMSHGDTIRLLPDNYKIIASTANIDVGAYAVKDEKTYGLQFHPEVYHTTEGVRILGNFLRKICGCHQDWTAESFIEATVAELNRKLGSDHVVLGISGGVDSSVAAMLLHRAIGDRLTCIFVDNGLLRKNEFEDVLDSYKDLGLNVIGVDASNKFLDDLKGIDDPEAKRKSIGRNFIEVFGCDRISFGQRTFCHNKISSQCRRAPCKDEPCRCGAAQASF